ncbi:MAG TPA: glycosyltransferase family 4 protein, partial [Gemmataceae bacterium]
FSPLPQSRERGAKRPKVTVLYHYFHPDDVVSARHFDGLCRGLADQGWDVLARPCNRGCRAESQTYPLREEWNGIHIRRVWRPRFRQASNLGRLVNAAWMLVAWSLPVGRRPDVLVVGTDPILSVLVAIPWRLTRPGVKIAHWAFDLYPEAAVADGMLRGESLLVRGLRAALRVAYGCCDLIADLGGCMRRLLGAYRPETRKRVPLRKVTLVPWALSEPDRPVPPDPAVRRELFGGAALGLLYSGNFGRAHSYEEFLALARHLRGDNVAVCFAVRGNRADELRKAVRPDDANVAFAGFAPEAELERRLAAADVHLVSLRPEWTGVVVPSKFFGSLAAGRPVVFAGGADSAIAGWVREFGVGWVLTADNAAAVAADLRALAADPARLAELQRRCHAVYQEHFSWRAVTAGWDRELRGLLPRRGEGNRR